MGLRLFFTFIGLENQKRLCFTADAYPVAIFDQNGFFPVRI